MGVLQSHTSGDSGIESKPYKWATFARGHIAQIFKGSLKVRIVLRSRPLSLSLSLSCTEHRGTRPLLHGVFKVECDVGHLFLAWNVLGADASGVTIFGTPVMDSGAKVHPQFFGLVLRQHRICLVDGFGVRIHGVRRVSA